MLTWTFSALASEIRATRVAQLEHAVRLVKRNPCAAANLALEPGFISRTSSQILERSIVFPGPSTSAPH